MSQNQKARNKAAYVTVGVWACLATVGVLYLIMAGENREDRIEALEDSVRAMVAMRESTDHGFMVADGDAIIREWNPALEKWTGYRSDEMVGKNLKEIMSEDGAALYLAKVASAMENAHDNGETQRVKDVQLIPKDPQATPVDVTISVRGFKSPDATKKPYMVAQIDRPENVVEVEEPEE